MDRRRFLTRLGLAVLAAGAGAAALQGGVAIASNRPPAPAPTSAGLVRPRFVPPGVPAAEPLPLYFPPPSVARVAIPGGMIHGLPGSGNLVALTVDDGISSEVVAAYADFVKRTGMRITFFVTSTYPAWSANVEVLRPLIESGHVQMANHTHSHPDLVKSDDDTIRRELERCGRFIRETFGVEAAPYFRPPYGNADARVLAAARSVGYRQAVHWYGSIGDSGPISDENMSMLVDRWFTAQRIVIGHANVPTVLGHFDEIAETIRARGLQPVTLDDVFAR